MRPASRYAKAIVAAITAVATLLGIAIAPADYELAVAGVIDVLGVLGVIRVPNEEPPTAIEALEGEPEEGDTTTLGTPIRRGTRS
jgi:hypothetical protein